MSTTMSTTTKSPSNQAAKGSKSRNKRKSGLTVTGYVLMSDGEYVPREDLPLEEQRRLATVWNISTMQNIGYEPVYRSSQQHREGVAKE